MQDNRQAPPLYYGNVPEAQQHPLQLVGHALDNLEYYYGCFEADLKLYDYCAAQLKKKTRHVAGRPFRDWQFVAARDGALSIYHFGRTLQALDESLSACPWVSSRLEKKELKLAKKNFSNSFPNYIRVRDAVGHAGEKARNTREHIAHGFSGTYRKKGFHLRKARAFVATDALHGRAYSNTWQGKIESYRISGASLRNLSSVRDTVFDAFDAMNAKFRGE